MIFQKLLYKMKITFDCKIYNLYIQVYYYICVSIEPLCCNSLRFCHYNLILNAGVSLPGEARRKLGAPGLHFFYF